MKQERFEKDLTDCLEDITIELIATGKWGKDNIKMGVSCNFLCEYCGKDFLASTDNYKDWHTDHLIPQHKGGLHDEDNLVQSCKHCNFFKGKFDPRIKATANATREELLTIAKEEIRARRQKAQLDLETVRKILGYITLENN